MKFAFILLATVIFLPSTSIHFKNNMVQGNIKPYSQPLPATTNYIAGKESIISRDEYFAGIDPIITSSYILPLY